QVWTRQTRSNAHRGRSPQGKPLEGSNRAGAYALDEPTIGVAVPNGAGLQLPSNQNVMVLPRAANRTSNRVPTAPKKTSALLPVSFCSYLKGTVILFSISALNASMLPLIQRLASPGLEKSRLLWPCLMSNTSRATTPNQQSKIRMGSSLVEGASSIS